MRRLFLLFLLILICACASVAPTRSSEPAPRALDASVIERAAGTPASVEKDGVVRISWPRSDVSVSVDGQRLPPAAGFSSWAAFQPTEQGAMLAGDTAVFEDEVDAAMDAAFESGLAVTALHNHFFYDVPRAFFMHIEGHGDPATLAGGVRKVWDAVKGVRAMRPEPADRFGGTIPESGSLNRQRIENVLGYPAPATGQILKMTIAREGTMHGTGVGGSMGLTTWAAFIGTDERASVAGDFIMTADEVQPVLRALRGRGIHIVALHNHMMGEQPTLYFTHFWGRGPAADLARGIRAALDAQAAAGN